MDSKEKTGYIYVLTNESFHMENWIKIGYAEDVDKRVKELSGTAVPLPYEVYCTYEIPRIKGSKDPDKLVHDLIQTLNPDLRISSNREFFELYPWEAYNMLSAMAKLHNCTDKLVRNVRNDSGSDNSTTEYSVEYLFPKDEDVYELYEKLKNLILTIDKNININPVKRYVSFRIENKNIVGLWPRSNCIEVVVNAKKGTITDASGILYDISNRQWPSTQYAFKYYDDTDSKAVLDIITQSYLMKK